MLPPASPLGRIKQFGAAVLLGASALAAQAGALITYDFTVLIDTQGTSISNDSFNGSFTYEDGTGTPSGGAPGGSDTLFALTDFSFSFAGATYVLADLAYADAVFGGGTLLGLEAGEALTALFIFTPGDGTSLPFFSFDLGGGDAGNGSVEFVLRPEPLSAPGGLVLVLAALAAAGATAARGRRS